MSMIRPFGVADDEARVAPWLILLVVGTLLYRIAFVWMHDYSLFVDEAQYWVWSRELQFGYYSKPPLVAWLIHASTWLLDDSELGIKLPALLAYPLASLGLYQLGRAMRDARTGLLASAVFLSMPGEALGGWVLSPDALLLVAWCWSLWLFWMALQQPAALKWWLWLGVAIGLGALAKYTMLVFVPLVGWVLWRRRAELPVRITRMPGPWLVLVIALLLMAPNILWNMGNQFETVKHTAELTHTAAVGLHSKHALEFIAAQWAIFGLLALPLLLVLVVRDNSVEGVFLRPFTIIYLLLITLLSFVTFANANWGITAFAAGSVWVALGLRTRNVRWTWAVIGLNVLLQLGLMHYRDIGPRIGHPPSRSGNDPFARVLGWRELGQALQPMVIEQGHLPILSGDRTLLAQLSYYLKPHPYPVAALDTDGRVTNSFEMETVRRGLPNEVLWVEFLGGQDGTHGNGSLQSDADDPELLGTLYMTVADLGVVRVRRNDGPMRNLHVMRMRRIPAGVAP